MKILLVHPITSFKSIEEDRTRNAYPTGIGYVGAYLEQNGHDVVILDNNQKCYSKEKLVAFFEKTEPDIVGIGAMVNSYHQVLQLSKLVKDTLGVPIVLGGPMATYSAETVLNNMDVDVCVLGEGEETSGELFGNWPNISNVDGIAYIDKSGNFTKTLPRVCQYSRDDYPYPGYDTLLDITKYWRSSVASWQTPFLHDKYMRKHLREVPQSLRIATMVTGLGCPFKCTFCTNSTIFMNTRFRSAENVGEEARYLKEKYNIEGIRFEDDLLILNKKRTKELCEALKDTGLKWAGHVIGRTADNEELVKMVSESGCVGLGIGIETASDRLLTAMRKDSRTKHYQNAFNFAVKYGIGIRVQLMYGSPGESKETLQETIDWFRKTKLPPRKFNKLLPMPGSFNYDQCVEQNIITNEHDYLSFASTLSGYRSEDYIFNITDMTDDEYVTNHNWAWSELYTNYEKIVKSEPSYWIHIVTYYIKKLFSIKTIYRRLKRVYNNSAGIIANVKKNGEPSGTTSSLASPFWELLMSSGRIIAPVLPLISFYPDLLPTQGKTGFVNKPLKDERIDEIFFQNESKNGRSKKQDIQAIEMEKNFQNVNSY